eukprot:gnl/TRDRNA2_/TRDRNA2_90182_c0_seq1.p1 gnl/TRDRNA2_/TRDRNA2_90182_c0~~gnl/TRDRNA2_/TRDRNA2_90182_c0_seq1.p1  ORF type:complete len:297 (+),score=37.41 gnl/TRDRNA2_/TRDRNA2_90182_c0_seq1:76-966(+)
MTAIFQDSANYPYAVQASGFVAKMGLVASDWPQGAPMISWQHPAWNCSWTGSTQLNMHDNWHHNIGWEENHADDHNDYRRVSSWELLPEEPRQEDVLLVNSTSSGACDFLCADAAKADCVAFDAEWVPDWTSSSDNPISVLQLAFPASRRVYVIQLAALQRQLPPAVRMMLVNPEVTKIGFACDQQDLDKLRRSGIAVTRGSVVDLQEQCATILGMQASSRHLSLKKASSGLLGFEMNKTKRLTCSDWSREKLSPEQVRYAALDAWVALRLYLRLRETSSSAGLCEELEMGTRNFI